MNWHWPQYAIAGLMGVSFLCQLVKEAGTRQDAPAAVSGTLAVLLVQAGYAFILYCGGFWTP